MCNELAKTPTLTWWKAVIKAAFRELVIKPGKNLFFPFVHSVPVKSPVERLRMSI